MTVPEFDIDITAIADRFDHVRESIEKACQQVGRSSDDVSLIAVSKTFPLPFVEAALSIGHQHLGENRVQELVSKASEISGAFKGGQAVWHMIGHIQRNKAKAVVEHADMVHAVDSPRLARALDARASEAGRQLDCLIQVNTSEEGTKFGLTHREAAELVDKKDEFPHLRFCGLMTIARPVANPDDVRQEFSGLHKLLDSIRKSSPQMQYLSMGMSGDFHVAIEEGATHIRLGTALFGPRSCSIQ